MSIPTAALSKLAKEFSKSKTVKSIKGLKDFTDGVKNVKESGAMDLLNDTFSQMSDSTIPMKAFEVFVALVKAESTQESVRLFIELMELFGLNDTEKGATAVGEMVKELTGSGADLVSIANSLNQITGDNGLFVRFGRALLNIFAPFDLFITMMEDLARLMEWIAGNAGRIKELADAIKAPDVSQPPTAADFGQNSGFFGGFQPGRGQF